MGVSPRAVALPVAADTAERTAMTYHVPQTAADRSAAVLQAAEREYRAHPGAVTFAVYRAAAFRANPNAANRAASHRASAGAYATVIAANAVSRRANLAPIRVIGADGRLSGLGAVLAVV